MGSVPPLLAFLLVIVSGWVHRQQLIVIEFLQAENRMLKQRLRGKRIRFTDDEQSKLSPPAPLPAGGDTLVRIARLEADEPGVETRSLTLQIAEHQMERLRTSMKMA